MIWAVTAAVAAIAALQSLRAVMYARATRAAQEASARAAVRADLADLTLAREASAALRVTPAGTVVTCGTVPADVFAAIAAPQPTPLGRAVTALLEAGTSFRHPIAPAGAPAILVGTLEGGHPTLFVEPATHPIRTAAAGPVAARLEQLLAAAPHPVWLATEAGDRVWANAAYARAVGGGDGDAAAVAAEPLLDANAAAQLAERTRHGVAHERVQTVVGGARRTFEVTADQRDATVAALAIDVSDTAHQLAAQARTLESHAATFDRLATAIAIYGPDRRLTFTNAAFQTLWDLPPALLEQAPPEERILDHLRAERRLPETADARAWKREQLRIYDTREGFERWWHLPDGQSLRVIANAGSDGGVTTIYENVTEQLVLERNYNALSRVQAEIIDNLGEGIASFGPDGLLRLANPAFWSLTDVPPAEIGDHVRTIAASASGRAAFAWAELSRRVTGLTDHRTPVSGRIEQASGRVLDYAFTPLPDGSTLATIADVTDTVNVARALTDRNGALIAADRLKNAFIEHVSYELRSPLNTIIGFTQLLERPETGALTDRQRDYASYIFTSSEALLVIIDGILDLASIDAGIMELSIAPVDVREELRQVLDGLKNRIAEKDLDIAVEVAPGAETFDGDALRVRQIVFNLLSNAVSHSPQAGGVTVAARRDGDYVALSVRDRGPGISAAKAEAVFERFTTSSQSGRRGGVGLGLSLVKSFVELHGGTVAVAPVVGPGAELVVRFPRTSAATVANAA